MSKTLYLHRRVSTDSTAAPVRVIRRGREVTSYWYPTWLAQPAALTPKIPNCSIARRTALI